jgi:hypothetical protein
MKKIRKEYRRPIDYITKQYSPVDLAYLAGIIDGEGCFWIGLVPRKSGDGYVSEHYRGLLKITNTDKKLIDWLLKIFEGTQSATMKYQPKGKFEREVFEWVATGDRLLDLCEIILPYLLLKKEHCEIMIKFRKTYNKRQGSTKIDLADLVTRRECMSDIRQLNSRFHNHPLKKHNQKSS